MKITRPAANQLVVEESLVWLAWVLGIASLALFYDAMLPGRWRSLFVALLLAACALLCVRKSRFVFDAGGRVVRWRSLVFPKVRSGSLAFDDIEDIGIESSSGGEEGGVDYRLTIITSGKPIPIGFSYEAGSERYAAMRRAILALIRPNGDIAADLESSAAELVRNGRTIDAITLLRSMENLSLTEAKRRVAEIKRGAAGKS